MANEKHVPVNLRVPESVRRAMKAYAHQQGLTDKGAWLRAARALGVEVPDEAIDDGRVSRPGHKSRMAKP